MSDPLDFCRLVSDEVAASTVQELGMGRTSFQVADNVTAHVGYRYGAETLVVEVAGAENLSVVFSCRKLDDD